MKRISAYISGIAAVAALYSAGFSQMFDGPGDGRGDGHFDHRGMMPPEMHAIVEKLNLETTMETFHVNVQKARLDAAEKKIPLKEKSRLSMESLKSLFKKFDSDKTVSKDIIQALKDLNGTRIAIRQIDRDVLAKIRVLRDGLDSDIDKAADAYIQKLASGGADLDSLAKHFNSFDRQRIHREMDNGDEDK
ncbi:MAG: hypothetical protein ABSG94_04530 [Brevinematales bacterium]